MYIKVKVHADEKRDAVVRKGPDALEIGGKAPAERREANRAVAVLDARELGKEEEGHRLIKGATSPAKIFEY